VTADPHIFDRQLLMARRARVAARAAEHEFLLTAVADDLVERLAAIQRTFRIVVNLGAHHGLLGRRLRALTGVELVIDAEATGDLLVQCGCPRVQSDEEVLPFKEHSLDLVASALAFQFVNDLPGALAQIRRALKPDGLLLAAMLGGNTLFELRTAFALAEEETEGGASPRVSPFADVRDLGALLQRAQYALPVVDAHSLTVTYPDALALMRELRAMGATNILKARRRLPLRRATLQRAVEHYARLFGLPNGRIPATFEVLTLTGWAPHANQQQALRPGSARMRLADALGTMEQPAGDKAGPGGGGRD
jgi:NADH dehydrogenase [ubiquinone] 1 alpha subcomplex assembly factor 5